MLTIEEMTERRRNAVAAGLSPVHPFFVERTNGVHVWGVDGQRYLDFGGGIGCVNVGNSHPAVVAAVQEQAGRSLHSASALSMHDLYVPLCERLNSLAFGERQNKSFLTNSGSEAVENSIRIARAFTGRQAVISFAHAFHGRTALGGSLSGDPNGPSYRPMAVDTHRTPYPRSYRTERQDAQSEVDWTMEQFDSLLDRVGRSNVAAVIVEPIQGEGGFIIPPERFFSELTARCADAGIVTIADEIQTGFGRTGTFLASQWLGFVPDIVVMGKSIADGLPLAAITGRAEVMDWLSPGGLGGTYGGNVVACAAALAVIEVMEQEQLLERAQRIGEWIADRTGDYDQRFRLVGDVRIAGAMAAIELVTDRGTQEPAAGACGDVIRGCLEDGLIVVPAGPDRNVIRLLGPLTLDDEDLNAGFAIIESQLSKAC